MIRHIVLFGAADPAHIDTIIDTLRGYRDIPGVLSLEVTRNLKRDPFANEVDVVLHALFENEAALQAYKQHPIYREGTRVVRPLRTLRHAVDIPAGGAEARANSAAMPAKAKTARLDPAPA